VGLAGAGLADGDIAEAAFGGGLPGAEKTVIVHREYSGARFWMSGPGGSTGG
jgi:hypothetical protein